MKPNAAILALAIACPLAPAQFIIQGVQFGGANVSSEAASHDDAQDMVDGYHYQFDDGFQTLSEFAEAESEVLGSFGRGDALQTASFDLAPGRFRIDLFAITAALGQTDFALPGRNPNTSAANASSSFVVTLEARERFELHIDGSLLASSFGLGESLSQLFIYDQNGVLVQASAASTGDQEIDSLDFDERLILPPGHFVIELISFGRQETFAFEDTGILTSGGAGTWLFTFDMRALPSTRSARP